MAHPLQTVNRFLELTNTEKNVAGAAQLMDKDIRFTGPVMQTVGVSEYVGLLEQFLSAHVDWKVHQRFETGDEACVLGEIVIRSPDGSPITLEMAEWYRVSDGKIAEHRVYYDPREFISAFGME